MSFKAIFYAYVLGGITFIPLVFIGLLFYTAYTSVPVGDPDPAKFKRASLEQQSQEEEEKPTDESRIELTNDVPIEVNDLPRPRKGWLTVRRTFEEAPTDGSYVGLVRGFLDARSKDPKRSRPKDMWYVVLKGKILYLYEDESMVECEAAIELGGHDIVVYPEGLLDGELFAKRNAICLKPKVPPLDKSMPSVTKDMKFGENEETTVDESADEKQKERERARIAELEKRRDEARNQALEVSTPWFIFVRSCVEMEDWYHSLVHASDHPANAPTLAPLSPVFKPSDMNHLVTTLDEQPDVIPMRWLNALIGRVFFSFYRTQLLESYIIGRLMRKLSKVKRPGFLTHIVVKEVSVGNTAPTLSKPMLKELTKEGDASMEVHIQYKGEIRITVEAVATINLGARFKSYTVKLVLAAVLRELEGNLLVKVKRPPSNRLWYAFTTMPRMVLDVEPVVSDRQITWGMILSTIESRLKEVIQESVVLPNMDDIAFFDSSKSSHRGGIYGDTSRNENPPSSFPESPSPTEDDRTTASEPVIDTVPPVTSSSPEPKAPLQRSHSAEEAESSKTSDPAPGLTRPATVNASGYSSNNSNASSSSATKRKSWFSAAKEGGNDDPFGDVYDDGYSRGRPNGVDPMRRSPSPHNLNGVTTSETEVQNDRHLSPAPDRSALSHRSQSTSSQGPSEPPSVEDTSSTSAPSESLLSAFRSRSPSLSLSKKDNGTSSGSNFFQTLKSRDKQAISNTAKEAMRKWGVNWGSLKKDNVSTVTTSDQDTSADPTKRAQTPEQPVQKPRPSYAEVRAAVEQRRERERAETEGPGVSDSQTTLHVGYGHTRSRSTSSSAPSVDQQRSASPAYLGGASLSPSTSPRPPVPVEDERLDVPSRPPSPRARTLSHRSTGPAETGSLPDEVEHPSDVPLHTRPPQPKMMTIPGIHASHRGEVMSMGYAPPPPAPSEPKKAPAIQSFTRLWNKSASSSGQPQVQSGFTGNDQDANSTPSTSSGSPPRPEIPSMSSANKSPGSPPTLPSRPIPPPLPPRSNTMHAVQTKPDSPRAADTDQGASPASAALQSIVSKDRTKRESLGKAPPSPTRREDSVADHTVSDQQGSGVVNLDSDSAVDPFADNLFVPSDVGVDDDGTDVAPKPPALPPRRIQASA